MFTPRGVTKRLRAAVTGYYVLPQLLLLLLTGRRRSAAVLLLLFIIYFICLISGITYRDSVTKITNDSCDIIYLSSRPLHRCRPGLLVGP